MKDIMNIAIVGYGKMGRAIAISAVSTHRISAVVDPNMDKSSPIQSRLSDTVFVKKLSDLPKETIKKIDVFIEFTSPDSALENIKNIMELKTNARIVSGTTGWELKAIDRELNKSQALLLHSSNFSLGINIISKMLASISMDLKKLGSFDASMVEYHHKNKKDAPSGTAKTLAQILQAKDIACPISSVRSGHYPGTHSISLDSEFETIEIKHTARNRDLFCNGVLISADWLLSQTKPGLYKFSDVISA